MVQANAGGSRERTYFGARLGHAGPARGEKPTFCWLEERPSGHLSNTSWRSSDHLLDISGDLLNLADEVWNLVDELWSLVDEVWNLVGDLQNLINDLRGLVGEVRNLFSGLLNFVREV